MIHRLKLYTPHEKQLAFHQNTSRFRVCAWGRQSGKSTGALNDNLAKAWKNPNTTRWFISPTYDQAKVQYRRLVGMLWPISETMLKKNQTELRVKLINQSSIVFKSGQNFEALRGETINGATIDEVRDQDPKLWPMVIRPMLLTTGGTADFISTPNGFDQFYDLAKYAQEDKTGEWAFMKAPSSANPLITAAEIESMRRNMTEKQFLQEVMAEFVDLTQGKAYYAFTESNLVNSNPFCSIDREWSDYLPIGVAMDFNVNPMCWTLGQNKGDEFYWGDQITLPESNTMEAAEALASKVIHHKPGIVVVGDASGKSRSTASAGKTDYDMIHQIMKKYGIPCRILSPDANPMVKDRVNVFNITLRDGHGKNRMFINRTKCPTLIKDCERVTIKETTASTYVLDKSKDPTITHSSDGVGYYIFYFAGKQFDMRPTTMKVLIR